MNRPDLAPGETAVAMGPPVPGAGPSRGTTSAIRRMSPRPRRSQARTMRSKPMILVALLLAAFLVNLDTTLVNVALPAMVRQLHATTTQLQWVVDSYNLVFAALLLTFGSLSDRFGRKGMLLTGLAVVGTASLALEVIQPGLRPRVRPAGHPCLPVRYPAGVQRLARQPAPQAAGGLPAASRY